MQPNIMLRSVFLAFLPFMREAVAERSALQAQIASLEKTEGDAPKPLEGRLEYVAEKLGIEREVVKEFVPKASAIPAENASTPKVAFLFLTMKDLQWPGLWEEFFRGATPGDYSIYVHRAALKDEEAQKAHELPLKEFGAISVPWVKTGWCALFGVEVATLFAALQDPANVQFVFVSDTTVPLKSFDYVHTQLVKNSPSTSKFCLAEPATYESAGRELWEQESKRACVFRDFLRRLNPRTLKHHQWAVLARSHAAAVVRQASGALDVYQKVWTQAAPDVVAGEGCSDEAVPLIALLHDLDVQKKSTGNTWTDFTRLGIEENCLTYVRWRNCFGGTELSLREFGRELGSFVKNRNEVMQGFLNPDFNFMATKLKRELNGFPHAFSEITEAYLRSMVSQGFMFARKFNPDVRVTLTEPQKSKGWRIPFIRRSKEDEKAAEPRKDVTVGLEELLPKLWAEVNAEKAQAATWSRLQSDGAPGALNRIKGSKEPH
eukprot:TRINITY_DN90582_c0_g1_i1.p1 TRINITY_DN90582_c0_g1~~TRINITY_DN90582_c0_g1_i1.p1  ORF type:complete len:513 (-),score=98.17 TRINITY_DN90582_c0_g1_i1:148-1617(-)